MSASNGSPEIRSYHGQPVIKEPVWTAEIPLYFFSGGLAGASAGLAYLSDLRGEQQLAKRAWGLAFAGIAVSPVLLISDLGKPARFLNMLRMFKVTSPMSVGSWILTGSGGATSIAVANAWTGLFPRLARIAKPSAALLGLPLSTYTAALVANTAVPAWHGSRRMLPFVFASGAALSAGAAAVAVTPPSRAGAARRLALGAAMLEGPLMELTALQLGECGKVYRHGRPGLLANIRRACTISGSALLYRRGGYSRPAAAVSGALLCGGVLATRRSVYEAGFASVRDPKYVIAPQREKIKRGDRRGGARMQARVDEPRPEEGSPATVRP
jgi:hypothetical protein